jgi:DNA topoisomerase-3
METAGTEYKETDITGIGTPATRAAIIEKLVNTGFVERQKKNLIPTEKGRNLIAVLPDTLTSPKLTADWEHRLLQVQRNELSESSFMSGIADFIKEIVNENNVPKPEYAELFKDNKNAGKPAGSCPRCGNDIRESKAFFFCDNNSCGFKLWKEAKFWMAKRKPLTADIAAALLKNGRVALKGLYSERTGKKYDAVVILDDSGEFVNYKMEFGGTR